MIFGIENVRSGYSYYKWFGFENWISGNKPTRVSVTQVLIKQSLNSAVVYTFYIIVSYVYA